MCTAQDQCHAAGVCNPATGVCSTPAQPNGTACNDGSACTQMDSCQVGACVGAAPVVCTAQDQCHDVGTCSPGTGACSNPPKADGSTCTDGNACTQTDTCQAGACAGANATTCTAQDQCHTGGTCNPATGACSNPPVADGTTCTDGNSCTRTDSCQAGACAGANPVTCLAQDQCHTAGSCDPGTGACANPPAENGTTCTDGNSCTQTDSCQAGTCAGANPVLCNAQDQCHTAGTCDPGTGACSNPPVADGTSCNDGSACTQTDTCQAASCTGGNPVTCAVAMGCSSAGTCDTGTGTCSPSTGCSVCGNGVLNPPEQCDDGNVMDGDGCSSSCGSELCFGVSCMAQDACHNAGVCDAMTGQCSNPAKTDGTGCSDGNFCNGAESCQQGTCAAGSPPAEPLIMATNQCRTAVCHPSNGWQISYKDAGASCADSTMCNGQETCDVIGVCMAGTPPVVDDVDPCTSDACDAGTGAVTHAPAADGTVCSPGDVCNGVARQVCRGGGCVSDGTLVPYGSTFRYRVYALGAVPGGYGTSTFDDSAFGVGSATFGSGALGCAIEASFRTTWPANTELVLRKQIDVSPGTTGLRIKIAIDNDIEVYFNDSNITAGLRTHDGCAENNQLEFDIADGLLRSGANLLAIRGRDRGGVAALDVQLTAVTLFSGVVDDQNSCTADACDAAGGVRHVALADGSACRLDGLVTGRCRESRCQADPNKPPTVTAGSDRLIEVEPGVVTSTVLSATASDDGLPGPLTFIWRQVSGPPAEIQNADSATTGVLFSQTGVYTFGLTVADGALSESDEVIVTIAPPGVNTPPMVFCGADRILQLPQDTVAFSCTVTDDGRPSGSAVAGTWTQIDGPATAMFTNATTTSATVRFPARGVYTVRLQATDGQLSGTDDVRVTIVGTNSPPIVNAGADQTLSLSYGRSATAPLAGVIADDGNPTGVAVTSIWTQVKGPARVVFGDFTRRTTTATFTAVGTYLLRLQASDGLAQASDDVTVVVAAGNQPPLVNAGADQSVTLPTRTVALVGTVNDDGKPAGAQLTQRWSLVTGPGAVVFGAPLAASTSATFDTPGSYVLRLTAQDTEFSARNDMFVLIAPVPPVGDAPRVAITSPGDLSTVTAPIEVRGTVASDSLVGWRLEERDRSQTDEWHTIAAGDSPVADGVLGRLDPTLLLNGIYQLRLVASDTSGRTAATPEDQPAINVRGNFKVGQFAVSFLETSIPVSGIPIQLMRNYDSRDTGRKGDFGYGWTLESSGMRVSESGKMGRAWAVVRTPDFLPTFCVRPTRKKHVTVTVAGGRVFEFEAEAEEACETFSQPSLVSIGFKALGGTNAKLATSDGQQVVFQEGQLLDANGDVYDPHTYVLTLVNGQEFLVSDRTGPQGPGLKSITDLNGNNVTFSQGGITHSEGTALVINRDADSRITSIVDPMGKAYTYGYDLDGNLASATDPVGNITRFRYDLERPHHLVDVLDPRGVPAARNDYDDDGRLISTTDAAGKVTAFTHDIDQRREVIVDRTGAQTLLEYDVRGNVTKETDAEGGVTTRTFDLHDNETSKTDQNGHTWAYEYDARDFQTKVTDPLNAETTRTFIDLGKVLTETDPLGHTTTNGYDLFGNVVSTTDALQNTTTYLYSPRGDLKAVTDSTEHATSYFYDRHGFMTMSTDRLGHVTTFTNDANGRRLTETRSRTTASGTETLVTTFVYDSNGRVIETRQPDGSVLRTTFNAIGKEATRVDALGRTTTMTYDDLGQLTRTTHLRPAGILEGCSPGDRVRVQRDESNEAFLKALDTAFSRCRGYLAMPPTAVAG